MRLCLIAATIVVLALSACNGATESALDMDPENTLIETAEYTGALISANGASEFGYLFDEASTQFWGPFIGCVFP